MGHNTGIVHSRGSACWLHGMGCGAGCMGGAWCAASGCYMGSRHGGMPCPAVTCCSRWALSASTAFAAPCSCAPSSNPLCGVHPLCQLPTRHPEASHLHAMPSSPQPAGIPHLGGMAHGHRLPCGERVSGASPALWQCAAVGGHCLHPVTMHLAYPNMIASHSPCKTGPSTVPCSRDHNLALTTSVSTCLPVCQ